MTNKTYNWKRFWCPRGGTIGLSDRGYLSDPDSSFGQIVNKNVVPISSIIQTPCLILLGEPGMGKTYTMEAELSYLKNQLESEGNAEISLDLRRFSSEERLIRDLFERPKFRSWIQSQHRLHLFLDSLDEGRLKINTLTELLIDEFKKCPINRLSLCITCRTAVWPNSMEEDLKNLWGRDSVQVYESAPLRCTDVALAASTNGLDATNFLEEIEKVGAVPLAIKPITLNFLLNIYTTHQQFPQGQSQLYLEGCRYLCETSTVRQEANLTGLLNADQRLMVASRIAAFTIFANRNSILVQTDQGSGPDDDLLISDLRGGGEGEDNQAFEVTEEAIKDTLDTGLFSSRGPHRLGWAHQTYAEFLAAHYLSQPNMSIVQQVSLLTHPGDQIGKIVPQLHETAAWLASMNPDVFQKILLADPEVLLRSDVVTANEEDRVTLVESLLKLIEEEKLLWRDHAIRKRFSKLLHSNLAEQLRPCLTNSTSESARMVAIEIAETCRASELQGEIVEIALDTNQPLNLRVWAASAIVAIGDQQTKSQLTPLLSDPNDFEDELKGCALQALWPNHLKPNELFEHITLPKRNNFHGPYQRFLYDDLVDNLLPEGLLIAMQWIQSLNGPIRNLPFAFQKLTTRILIKAWDNLESSGVIDEFGKIALRRSKDHEAIISDRYDYDFTNFKNPFAQDDHKRRKILVAVTAFIEDPERESRRLAYSSTPLVMSYDVRWMLEQITNTPLDRDKRIWSYLILAVFQPRDTRQLDELLIAYQNHPILSEILSPLFKPIELNSPQARKLKENYDMVHEWEGQGMNQPPLTPSPAERIASALDQCESGDVSAWCHLERELTLEHDSQQYGSPFKEEIINFPGWMAADPQTKARIIDAAQQYILEGDPQNSEWLGTGHYRNVALAGYRAFRLLIQISPEFIDSLQQEVFKKWTPIILAFPTESQENGAKDTLIKKAYEHTPEIIIQTLDKLIERDNKELGCVLAHRKLIRCWDNHLATFLMSKVTCTNLKPEAMGNLLEVLLEKHVQEAKSFANSLISNPISIESESQKRAKIAAQSLVTHADKQSWEEIWTSVEQDAEFWIDAFSAVAYNFQLKSPDLFLRLGENQLADLYVWLEQHFPRSEDPQHNGAHSVGPRDAIVMWRDSILNHLITRGTSEACEAINQIIEQLHHLDWLSWSLLDAQNITRQKTWHPPQPQEILQLARNKDNRLVQTGDELLYVLIEALQRIEGKLQGETPAVIDLWNETKENKKKIYTPKDENRFSDWVKRQLKEDIHDKGIVVNREVEIRMGTGEGTGETTDIYVDAIVKDGPSDTFNSVSVIIEAKGCWHGEVKTAMETQLVNRYLKDNHCQHGLYLVGWFKCDKWDSGDSKKASTPNWEKSEAERFFIEQAKTLSEQYSLNVKAFVLNTAIR